MGLSWRSPILLKALYVFNNYLIVSVHVSVACLSKGAVSFAVYLLNSAVWSRCFVVVSGGSITIIVAITKYFRPCMVLCKVSSVVLSKENTATTTRRGSLERCVSTCN